MSSAALTGVHQRWRLTSHLCRALKRRNPSWISPSIGSGTFTNKGLLFEDTVQWCVFYSIPLPAVVKWDLELLQLHVSAHGGARPLEVPGHQHVLDHRLDGNLAHEPHEEQLLDDGGGHGPEGGQSEQQLAEPGGLVGVLGPAVLLQRALRLLLQLLDHLRGRQPHRVWNIENELKTDQFESLRVWSNSELLAADGCGDGREDYLLCKQYQFWKARGTRVWEIGLRWTEPGHAQMTREGDTLADHASTSLSLYKWGEKTQ